MYTIEKILESPYSAIILAAVLGGLALSGRFSVTATQLLFVAACELDPGFRTKG
jgi:hypothetical protein